jgi:cobalamin biosynthesis protein CbiD
VYAAFKGERQFWERLEHTRIKMLSYINQMVAEYGNSQKQEIVLLGHPGRAVNNPVSYLKGP